MCVIKLTCRFLKYSHIQKHEQNITIIIFKISDNAKEHLAPYNRLYVIHELLIPASSNRTYFIKI